MYASCSLGNTIVSILYTLILPPTNRQVRPSLTSYTMADLIDAIDKLDEIVETFSQSLTTSVPINGTPISESLIRSLRLNISSDTRSNTFKPRQDMDIFDKAVDDLDELLEDIKSSQNNTVSEAYHQSRAIYVAIHTWIDRSVLHNPRLEDDDADPIFYDLRYVLMTVAEQGAD